MYAAQQKSFFSKLVGIDGFVGFQKVPFKIVKVLDLFSSFQSFKDIDHINDLIFSK